MSSVPDIDASESSDAILSSEDDCVDALLQNNPRKYLECQRMYPELEDPEFSKSPYRFLRLLAKGSFSTVLECYDTERKCSVAVKLMPPDEPVAFREILVLKVGMTAIMGGWV